MTPDEIVASHSGDARAIAAELVGSKAARGRLKKYIGELGDENERLRAELAAARAEAELAEKWAMRAEREVEKLRARDEKAQAVVRWWNSLGGNSQAVLRDLRRGFRPGADALDALADAYRAAPTKEDA